jgi:hypothetical protein
LQGSAIGYDRTPAELQKRPNTLGISGLDLDERMLLPSPDGSAGLQAFEVQFTQPSRTLRDPPAEKRQAQKSVAPTWLSLQVC